jgi:RNA polymerase sigma factor (sigma-70 family)
MAGGRIHNLIRYLRRTTGPRDGALVPDGLLLERFVAGDQGAFEELTSRHGPMVLGVCRRVLGDVHEAEDAFQATFVVLARKAASVAGHPSTGAWLHTVAFRVAQRARARRASRTARERPLVEPLAASPNPADEAALRDLRRVIDEEVGRLPKKYRAPFVLFHLEGRNLAEVAVELGCPIGTVQTWLARARQRLRARLSRRGVSVAPALIAGLALHTAWSAEAAAARAASGAAAATVSDEAAVLADAVLKSFALSRVKVAAVALLLATAAGVAGLAAASLPREQPPAPPVQAARRDPPQPAEEARELKPVKVGTFLGHINGTNAVALSTDGKTLASGGSDFYIKLRDVATGDERLIREPGSKEIRLSDGSRWDMRKIPKRAHEGPVESVAFRRDGQILASGSSNDRTVKLWDVATGELKAVLKDTVEVYALAFSPDGKTVAVGGFIPHMRRQVKDLREVQDDWFKERGELLVWDTATGKARSLFRDEGGRILYLDFSPDGKILASVGRDGAVRLWDPAASREKACLREKDRAIHAAAFSPDGKTLALGLGPDPKALAAHRPEPLANAVLWDLAANRARARLAGHTGIVRSLAFSADGKLLATAADIYRPDGPPVGPNVGEVRLWDAGTGEPRGEPLICSHHARSVALGGRGHVLAVGGPSTTTPNNITVWQLGRRGRSIP